MAISKVVQIPEDIMNNKIKLALREPREALAARSQWDDGLTPSRGVRCQ
jgi:hypothetical protein